MSGAPPLVPVLLAAGAGRRLGTTKALVRLREAEPATPLALLFASARAGLGIPPLVVVGADADAVLAELPAEAEACRNPDWGRGRTGGIALAAALRPGCDLCLAPIDVPLVAAATFQRLAEAWREAGRPARGWLAPWIALGGGDGRRAFGHPVVVGRELAAAIAALGSDQPLRELRAGAQPLLAVRVEDAAILDDLDTPADLERLRARLRRSGGRSGREFPPAAAPPDRF